MGKAKCVDEVKNLAYSQLYNTKSVDRLYKKLDEYQRWYYECLQKYRVVFVDEPAGTGKTTIAVMAGLDYVRDGKKLVYIRFPSRRGERLGATPGELEDKEAKYMLPFYEALNECGLQDEAIQTLKLHGCIDARTDVQERGRNLKDCFVVVDEAQNAEDLEQLKLILTRPHDNCKVVVIGDSRQTDSKVKRYGKQQLNAFQVYQYHMTKKPWAVSCELKINYRGEISRWADKVDESLSEI